MSIPDQRPMQSYSVKRGVYELHTCVGVFQTFSNWQKNVNIVECLGRPATSRNGKNIADMCATVRGNCEITIRKWAEDVQISYCAVWSIITEDLRMRYMSAKLCQNCFQLTKGHSGFSRTRISWLFWKWKVIETFVWASEHVLQKFGKNSIRFSA